MLGKIVSFIILICTASACYIATGNKEAIICDNLKDSCYLQTENTILKTTQKINNIKINRNMQAQRDTTDFSIGVEDKNSSRTFSYGKKGTDFMSCYAQKQSISTNDGLKESTKYLLGPKEYYGDNKVSFSDTLNTYSSKTTCELDRQIIETYFNSDNKNILEHNVPSSYLNFLWYIGVVLFGALSILILFAKPVSKEEAARYRNNNIQAQGLSKEQVESICEKVQGITNFVSKFDSEAAKKIEDIAGQIKNFGLDINDKDKSK